MNHREVYSAIIISIVCGDCSSVHLGDCPARSTLSELDPKAGVDQASLTYTQLPVPAELTVKAPGIPGAGLGVFSNQLIPRNVKMGPYEGKKHWEKRLYFHGYTQRYGKVPYFLNFLEIWPFLIPFHTFPTRSIVMEIQSFFPVKVEEEEVGNMAYAWEVSIKLCFSRPRTKDYSFLQKLDHRTSKSGQNLRNWAINSNGLNIYANSIAVLLGGGEGRGEGKGGGRGREGGGEGRGEGKGGERGREEGGEGGGEGRRVLALAHTFTGVLPSVLADNDNELQPSIFCVGPKRSADQYIVIIAIAVV